jgi:hypothetical protein
VRVGEHVVHSDHGAGRLESELGLPRERIRVIPMGVFDDYDHPQTAHTTALSLLPLAGSRSSRE